MIVSYRCEALLRDCLASLLANPPDGGLTVRVVDNASGDGTAGDGAARVPAGGADGQPGQRRLQRRQQLGIWPAAALRTCSSSTRTRRSRPAPCSDWSTVMEEQPEVGMAGPRLELEDGSFDHASRRSFPTPLSALGHFTGRRPPRGREGPARRVPGPRGRVRPGRRGQRRLHADPPRGARTGRRRSTRATGCTWRTSTSVTASPRPAGRPGTSRAVTVIHVKAGTSGKHRSLRLNYAFHYGMYRFYRDHYAPQRNPLAERGRLRGIAVKLALGVARSGSTRPGHSPLVAERRADPLDRRRVGAEERARPARAGRGRRGSCARAGPGGRSAPAGRR